MSDENKKSIRAKLRFTSIEEFAKGYARYVSAGGIFIPTPESKLEPPGTIVRFQLSLASGEGALLGEGRVHKANAPNPDKPGAPVGLLLKFTRLSQSSKKLVDQIVEAKKRGAAPRPEPEPEPPASDHAPTPQPTVPVSVASEEPPASDLAPTPMPASAAAQSALIDPDAAPPPAADLAPTPMPGASAEIAAAMMSNPSKAFAEDPPRTRPRVEVPTLENPAVEAPEPSSEMGQLFERAEPSEGSGEEHWFRTGTGKGQDPLETSQGEENYSLFQKSEPDPAEGFDIFGDANGPSPEPEPAVEETPAPEEAPEPEPEPGPSFELDLDEGALDMLGSEVESAQPSEAEVEAQSAGRFDALEEPAESAEPSNPFGASSDLSLPAFSSSPFSEPAPFSDADASEAKAEPEPDAEEAPEPVSEPEGPEDEEIEAGVVPESATSLEDGERLRPQRVQTASGSYRTLAKTEGGLSITTLDDAGASGELNLNDLDLVDDDDAIDQMFEGLFGGSEGEDMFGGGGDAGGGLFGGTPEPSPEPEPEPAPEAATAGLEEVSVPPTPPLDPPDPSEASDEGDDLGVDLDALAGALGDDGDDEDDDLDIVSEVTDDGQEDDPSAPLGISESSVSSLEPPESDVLEEGNSDDEVFDLLGSLDEPSDSDGPIELHLAGPSTADSFVEETEDEDSLEALLATARKDLEEHQTQAEKDPVEDLLGGDLPPVPDGEGAFNLPDPTPKKKGGFLSRFLKRDD